MKIVSLVRFLLETITSFLKEAARVSAESALRVAIDEERKAQDRIVKAIVKYEDPSDFQRAYIDALQRELQVYERIRAAALERFERSTEEGTD